MTRYVLFAITGVLFGCTAGISPAPPKMSKADLTAFAPLKAPPALERPVVMVPGLTMPASSYDPLASHLFMEKANGPVVVVYVAATEEFRYGDKNGRVMNDGELRNVKIFQLEYSDANGAPTEKAPRIAKLLPRIAAATKIDTVDVVTHSAGGHDFRLYLDERPQEDVGIGKLVMIGPVSHGTVMGNFGAVFGSLLGVQSAAQQLAIDAPMVKRLDASWEKQRAQVREGVTIIGIAGAPTLGPGGIKTGDGFVQADQLGLPGARVIVLQGNDPTPKAHLQEVGYSGVVNEVQAALGR